MGKTLKDEIENKNPWEQDAKEVQKMVDFYKANYPEVYVLHCLENNHIIGIEVAGQFADGIVLEKGRTFYNYNDLCLSIRRREDTTDDNQPMYGYECVCGNKTTLATVEQGHVPVRTFVQNKQGELVSDSGATGANTPYEMAQIRERIAADQANSDTKADYEATGNTERYETFKLERVK